MPETTTDPQKQMSLPPSLQHRTDLGPSREDRRLLESGHSTTGYSSGRERLSHTTRPRPKTSSYKPNHPLMGEIERLLASCDSHEREIRAAQNTINHQLAEWAGKFDTLHELDTKAEQMAFEVKRMTQETSKEHTELVDSCIRDAEGWVAEARDDMQLWKQYGHDRDVSDVAGEKKEVMYTWKQWEAQIELVKRQYENEQERLDRLIADKRRSQRRKNSWTCGILGTLTMAVMVIWILLWTFEWRAGTMFSTGHTLVCDGSRTSRSKLRALARSLAGLAFVIHLPSIIYFLVPGWITVREHTKEHFPNTRRLLQASKGDTVKAVSPEIDYQGGKASYITAKTEAAPIYDLEWIQRYTGTW